MYTLPLKNLPTQLKMSKTIHSWSEHQYIFFPSCPSLLKKAQTWKSQNWPRTEGEKISSDWELAALWLIRLREPTDKASCKVSRRHFLPRSHSSCKMPGQPLLPLRVHCSFPGDALDLLCFFMYPGEYPNTRHPHFKIVPNSWSISPSRMISSLELPLTQSLPLLL